MFLRLNGVQVKSWRTLFESNLDAGLHEMYGVIQCVLLNVFIGFERLCKFVSRLTLPVLFLSDDDATHALLGNVLPV